MSDFNPYKYFSPRYNKNRYNIIYLKNKLY